MRGDARCWARETLTATTSQLRIPALRAGSLPARLACCHALMPCDESSRCKLLEGGCMLYQWIVYVHVLAVFAFLLAHGAATAITFKLRGERKIERIRTLLDLSESMAILGTVTWLVLIAAGIILGFMGNCWGHGWIWKSGRA